MLQHDDSTFTEKWTKRCGWQCLTNAGSIRELTSLARCSLDARFIRIVRVHIGFRERGERGERGADIYLFFRVKGIPLLKSF
jgi:hypothetical protein